MKTAIIERLEMLKDTSLDISDGFYAELLRSYHYKITDDIERLLQISASDDELRSNLETYLKNNWERVRSTNLGYTALPDSPVTLFLIDLAILLSEDTTKPPLMYLMPGLTTESTNPACYPNLAIAYQDKAKIQSLLKTHIMSERGDSLIPISLLIHHDILGPTPIPNVYFEVDFDLPDEVNRSRTLLLESEIERLYHHTLLTQAIQELLTEIKMLQKDDSTLLGQLHLLSNALYMNSVEVMGTETLSGVSIYTVSQSFFNYYHRLDQDNIETLPETLRNEINTIEAYFSGTRPADIGSCFATRRLKLDEAIRGHESLLSNITLSDAQKALSREGVFKALKIKFEELASTLEQNTYEGDDKLLITLDCLNYLNIHFRFDESIPIIHQLQNINAHNLATLFENEETKTSFLTIMSDKLEEWVTLFIQMPNEKLHILLKASLQENEPLNELFIEDFDMLENILSLLDDEKRTTLFNVLTFPVYIGRTEVKLTPLMYASKRGFEHIVTAFIHQGVDINETDYYTNTALLWSLAKKREHIAQLLIQHGADIQIRNQSGLSTLMAAAESGLNNIVSYLLDKGMPINEALNDEKYALYLALIHGYDETAMLLISRGANITTTFDNTTLLTIAIVNRCHKSAKLLLNKYSDNPMYLDNYGSDTLCGAICEDFNMLIERLLQNGVNPNSMSKGHVNYPIGQAAISNAVSAKETINQLIACGANIDIQNARGDTPLMLALRYRRKENARILIQAGANLVMMNNAHQSAIDFAVAAGFDDIVTLIRQKIADTPSLLIDDLRSLSLFAHKNEASSEDEPPAKRRRFF